MLSQPQRNDQIAEVLAEAMAIPAANRWVADWLFTNICASPFHRAHPLPPASLENSLSLNFTSVVHSMPDPKFRPSAAHMPPPAYLVPSSESDDDMVVPTTLSSMHNQLFLPVAEMDGISVGYSFVSALPDRNLSCMPSNPFNPPYSTRYLFAPRSGTLLHVTHGGFPRTIGLRLVSTVNPICRKHVCLLVPAADYAWPNLPAYAFCMISNIEYKLDSIGPPTQPPSASPLPQTAVPASEHDHLDIASGLNYLLQSSAPPEAPDQARVDSKRAALRATIGLIDAIIDTESSSPDAPASHQRSILPTAGSLPDGLAPATAPQDRSLTSAAFAPSVRCAALTPLRQTLSGLFTGPAVRMDARLPDSDHVTSTFTGRLSKGFAMLAPEAGLELRKRFANLYYFDVLSVSAAPVSTRAVARMIAPPGSAAKPAAGAGAASPGERTWRAKRQRAAQADALVLDGEPGDAVARLVPRPTGGSTPPESLARESSSASPGSSSGGRRKSSKEREAILEARRIRNRLSAQRSNLERKRRYERLESDLNATRSRAELLKQRRDNAARENERLKAVLDACYNRDQSSGGISDRRS